MWNCTLNEYVLILIFKTNSALVQMSVNATVQRRMEYSSKVVGIKVDCNAFKIVNDKNRPKGITKLFIDDCT